MRRRAIAASLCAAAGLQVWLVWTGTGGWPCPFFQCSGVPCPGCGMTRAGVALLRGEVWQSLRLHLFALPLAALSPLFAAALLLPGAGRAALLRRVEAFERRTRLTELLLIGLLCYWLARLALQGQAFVSLIKG